MDSDLIREAPVDVITVWGHPGVGKSLFGITSPYKPILVLDTERGTKLYQAHYEFTRVDAITYLGDTGLLKAIKDVKPGWGTIVIDSASQWCEFHSRFVFEREKQKVEKQSQLVWGMVKSEISAMILELMSKTQVLVLTAQARNKFGKPGQYEPKVLDPVLQFSSVVLQLIRDPNQRIPSANVTKSRILALPPRLPRATWNTILDYILRKPADWQNLQKEEMVEEEVLYPFVLNPETGLIMPVEEEQ